MDDSTRQNLTNPNIWVRGLYMIFFVIAYNISELILVLLAVFQFLSVLFTGQANEPLLRFGRNLSVYVEEIFEFLTFNTEAKPFPFEPWPDEQPGGESWTQSAAEVVTPADTTASRESVSEPVTIDEPAEDEPAEDAPEESVAEPVKEKAEPESPSAGEPEPADDSNVEDVSQDAEPKKEKGKRNTPKNETE